MQQINYEVAVVREYREMLKREQQSNWPLYLICFVVAIALLIWMATYS